MPAYFSLPADPTFGGGKNLMICSFLGDELTLDGIGLADGADIFVWNGKEVKEPNTLSPCQCLEIASYLFRSFGNVDQFCRCATDVPALALGTPLQPYLGYYVFTACL